MTSTAASNSAPAASIRPSYRIRPASIEDTSAVLGLRYDAERWLADSGINQWNRPGVGERLIPQQIEAGGTYVVEHASEHGTEVVASLNLGPGDPEFWTPRELREPAVYLYKFMIRSDHRGNGLGDVLLDWASAEAERRWGALFLRLDCNRDNTSLHQFYERRGFTHRATRSAEGRASGALFQRYAECRLVSEPRVTLIDGTDREAEFTRAPQPPPADCSRPARASREIAIEW